jgi:hypothetical protein
MALMNTRRGLTFPGANNEKLIQTKKAKILHVNERAPDRGDVIHAWA